MVREIITINIGQAGIQLSQSVWEQYCAEHEIDSTGKIKAETDGNIHCFFDETDKGTFVPRNLSVDLEPNVIDDIKKSHLSSLFCNDYLLSGTEDAANNFARGRFSVGREIMDQVNNAMKKLYENCDNMQGFIINHSVGGGTGSGLGVTILEELNSKYRKKSKLGFEIYPSQTISTCVVEPYNALLATSSLIDLIDISFMLDNEALYHLCKKKLDIQHPSYHNINRLISKSISSLTASIRFEGELNLDINDLRTNLVPFPKLHFMISSLAPILTQNKMDTFKPDARILTDECFNNENFFVNIPEFECELDKYMAALLMFRGNIVAKDANSATNWLKENKKCSFVEWSPCGFKICLNEMATCKLEDNSDNSGSNNNNNNINNNNSINSNEYNDVVGYSKCNAMMIGNNIGISRVFSNVLSKKFDLMYSQRAFIHWYVGEGMEECEFQEARENLGYLEKDYLDILNESENSDDSDNSDNDDDESSF